MPVADPVRAFYNELDAFPPLGAGNVGRLVLDTERTLLYSLGDENSNFPFQLVAIIIYGHEDYAIRYYRSVLPRNCGKFSEDSLKLKHFRLGRRVRDRSREDVFMAYFEGLRRIHGDVLRAYQLNEVRHRIDDDNLPHLIWIDVMRVILSRMNNLLRSPATPEDMLRVSQRIEKMYPYDHHGCWVCGGARRRWWRYRLFKRLVYHYPSLPKNGLRLLRDDIAYLVRFPYRSMMV